LSVLLRIPWHLTSENRQQHALGSGLTPVLMFSLDSAGLTADAVVMTGSQLSGSITRP
jgi:hypothetical protein